MSHDLLQPVGKLKISQHICMQCLNVKHSNWLELIIFKPIRTLKILEHLCWNIFKALVQVFWVKSVGH